ncbi:hypothetical protein SUGI_0311610 [Cryptomeria japonica]|uniref:annexin Gh1 n=1 Tax=Cryptomeria japonica TaxID=3369 RepID=UPI002408E9B3|nr:annexin Gh1 [Cryptomeria japonica]GLJ17818.1 hypothetical protein SUGI_0311610 [Cryptomeria japonica]
MSSITMPVALPTVEEDCEQLSKAFHGFGTNEKAVINILAHRGVYRRKMIKETYEKMYNEDLLKRLESELTRKFERAMLLWMLEPAERDAVLAHEAIKKWSSKDSVLVEICCSRSPSELLLVRKAYHLKYKKSLEEDIASHTSGDFQKLLFALASSFRYEGPEVDMHLAKSEAKILHEAIKDKARTDDIVRIISTRSKAQLNAAFNQLRDDFGYSINQLLKKHKSEDFQDAVQTAVKCIRCPTKYFAKILRSSMERMGTDDEALTRTVVTRADVDMKDIKAQFMTRTSLSLKTVIAKDTRGDYEDFLLALVGE